MNAAPARKYAYQRIAPGLILLRANDGVTMLGIARYTDGPTFGLENESRDFAAWAWGRVPDEAIRRMLSSDDTSHVRDWALDNMWPRHRTMRAAMEAALVALAAKETRNA